MIYPFAKHGIHAAHRTMTSSGGPSRTGASGGSGVGIVLGPSKPIRRKDNPLSIPGLTTIGAGESEERINRTSMDKQVGISVFTEVSSTSHRECYSPAFFNASYGSPKPIGQPQEEYRPYSAPTYKVNIVAGERDGSGLRRMGDGTCKSA